MIHLIIEMIHNNELETLVVISISRWGRNLGEIYKSVQLMETKGVNFLQLRKTLIPLPHMEDLQQIFYQVYMNGIRTN